MAFRQAIGRRFSLKAIRATRVVACVLRPQPGGRHGFPFKGSSSRANLQYSFWLSGNSRSA
eukprot:244892-Pleurochrysis_carterae.AAC.1